MEVVAGKWEAGNAIEIIERVQPLVIMTSRLGDSMTEVCRRKKSLGKRLSKN